MNANTLIKKLYKYIANTEYRFLINTSLGFTKKRDDLSFLKKKFKILLGYKLNLDSPLTYNEKLQWLKLYDRKALYKQLVDKYEVKKYISDIIGDQYVIPTLGVWDSYDEIDINSLPNQFVLKCTHDSGGIVICKNKAYFDNEKTKKQIEKALKNNYFYQHREWPYKDVKPRIIAEKYMEDSATGELRDYKFFAFNGKVNAMFVASERQKKNTEVKFDFFDRDYNHLPIKQGHPNADVLPEKPLCFNEMIALAEKLSIGIPQVRIDFYEVNGQVYFGEMTFFHFSGMVPFEPCEWDTTFGSWIDLSIVDKEKN